MRFHSIFDSEYLAQKLRNTLADIPLNYAARLQDTDETKNVHDELAARYAYATTLYGMVYDMVYGML